MSLTCENETDEIIARLLDITEGAAAGVEFRSLLMSSAAVRYLREYQELIGRLIPEMVPCFGFQQNNPYHIYDVYEHTLAALSYAPADLIIRTAVFFHDIGKPASYSQGADGVGHFKGHGRVSADLANTALKRLGYKSSERRDITQLIFYHDATFAVGKKYVRRWLNKIGEQQFRRLLEVKQADIYGHNPIYTDEGIARVERLKLMLEEVLQEQACFTAKDLAISGKDLVEIGCTEGAEIGRILKTLTALVVDGVLENESGSLLAYSASMIKKPE